jgi:hypothetical protein
MLQGLHIDGSLHVVRSFTGVQPIINTYFDAYMVHQSLTCANRALPHVGGGRNEKSRSPQASLAKVPII